MNKKGLSPVIATTLLVLIAVVLAAIIFWWVRQFVQESVQKDIGGGLAPIDSFCKDIKFNADISGDGKVTLQNNGQIPIYGLDVKKKGFATLKSIGTATSKYYGVQNGDTEDLQSGSIIGNVYSGDTVLLVPILLGQGNDNQKTYICDESFGVEVKVP